MAQGSVNSLTPEQNEMLSNMLGNRRRSKATAVVRLCKAYPDSDQWTELEGDSVTACCLVKDNLKKAHYIRLFDLTTKQMILEQEVHEKFSYNVACSYFHTFPGDGVTVGLSFIVDDEAAKFHQAVVQEQERLQERKRRLQEEESRRSVPQAPPPVTMVNNFVDRFNLTEEPLLNAILDVPQAPLPLATVEHLNFASESGTRPKPRKGKLTKSDFSVLGPVDFRHIGHVGLDPETGVFESLNVPEWKEFIENMEGNIVGKNANQIPEEEPPSLPRRERSLRRHLPSPPPGLLYMDPEIPKAILSDPPRRVAITPSGKEIDLQEEIGLSISIPKDAMVTDEQIRLATSFSGAYSIQDDVESVSPAYIIDTARKIEFSKDVEVKLQHTANVATAEDRADMMVLRASTTPSQKDSSSPSVHKFEELQGARVEFGARYALMKVKSFVSSIFKVGKKKRKGKEKFYSARLYKSVVGIKVKAVFCVCPEHPIYTKHCDKIMAQHYPEISDKAKGTFINAIIIKCDEVSLVKSDDVSWSIAMDRSLISALEVDSPERMNISIAELDDYPPKIHIDLQPADRTSAPVELKVAGLKKECSFSIVNECHMPDVNTKELVVATKEVETELELVEEYDSPLVTCAMDMVGIMNEVELLLHNHGSISILVKRVEQIEELIRKVDTLIVDAKTVKASAAKVTTISHQFKTVAPAMREGFVAGSPETWKGAVDVLMANSISLMNSIKELLKTTEIAAATSKGVSLRSMKLIKWKEEKFRLIDHVSSGWESFGLRLNIPYDKLEAWREECLGSAFRCWLKVMGHWLTGGGTQDYPATWEGLCLLLEDVEYSEVAERLRTIIAARHQ